MTLDNPFKLEKLKILAFEERTTRDGDFNNPVGTFEAMFYPETLKWSYQIEYGEGQGVGSGDQAAPFSHNRPSDLNIKLLLDGTGVHEMGILQLGTQKSVRERIDEFLGLTYEINGNTHEPNYLLVLWGEFSYTCRLSTVDVTCTAFDKDGKVLRAELNVTLVSDVEPELRARLENRSSPDLTHTRVVKMGDTLPLLAKEIYGNSAHYLFVAEQNRLDDFRNLTPGQALVFPPLPK